MSQTAAPMPPAVPVRQTRAEEHDLWRQALGGLAPFDLSLEALCDRLTRER